MLCREKLASVAIIAIDIFGFIRIQCRWCGFVGLFDLEETAAIDVEVYNAAGCLVLDQNGQTLALFKESPERTNQNDLLTLTGGKVMEFESFRATAERETREETGYEVKASRRLTTLQGTHGYVFHVYARQLVNTSQQVHDREGRPAWLDLKNHQNAEGWLYPRQVQVVTRLYHQARSRVHNTFQQKASKRES